MPPDRARDKIISDKVLQRLFPGVDPYHPTMLNMVNFNDQHDLVDALATFHSQAIDHAVYDLLKRTWETHPDNIEDVFERCELVHACALYMTKPDGREALDKSYREVMSHFPKDPPYPLLADPVLVAAFSNRFQTYLKNEIAVLAPH